MVHIITPRNLKAFIDANPQYALGINAWVAIVEKCSWDKPQDMVSEFGPKAVDLLGKKDTKAATVSCNRVVFDIKGNHIRIIAKYQFHANLKQSQLFIKWIGTHVDYDDLCAKKGQYDVEMFKTKK